MKKFGSDGDGSSYNAKCGSLYEADKDGSTVTLLDIMGQQDDNYDLTEKRMILERILPILSERKTNHTMYFY